VSAAIASSRAASIREWLRQRGQVLALVGLVTVAILLAASDEVAPPPGFYGQGLVGAAGVGLQALGLVLIFRSNRIINFAQVQVGALGAFVFVVLARSEVMLVGLHRICTGCVEVESVPLPGSESGYSIPVNVPTWLDHANYWLSMGIGLAVAIGISYLIYVGIIRRFETRSSLVMTVLTIGIAQTLTMLSNLVMVPFSGRELEVTGAAPLPVDMSVSAGGVVFQAADIAQLGVAVLALTGVALLMRFSTAGILLRGVADNRVRAQTLGVNVSAVSSLSWILAGALSGLAGIFVAMTAGSVALGGLGSADVQMLAAAVLAGFSSLPLALAAAMVLGLLDRAILWAYEAPALLDGLLLPVLIGALLLMRQAHARTDSQDPFGATEEARPIPAELRSLPVVRTWRRNGLLLLSVVLLGAPWFLSTPQTNVAITTLVFGMLALSILVLTGWAGQITLGQFGFAGVGAFVTAVLGWPLPFGPLAGGLAGAAVAAIIGLPALRLKGLNLAIMTLSFAAAVSAILLNPRYLGHYLPELLGRPSLLGLDLDDERTFYYVTLVVLALMTLAVVGMRRSRTARVLMACRDNDSLAQAYGVSLLRARLSAFVISGYMASVAGGLYAYAQFGVEPEAFGVGVSTTVFLIAVLGGLGSIAAPLVGAAFYGVTRMLSSDPIVSLAATGAGVVAVLIFMPGGLGAAGYRIRDAFLRRVAIRQRITVPSLMGDRAATDPRAPIAANSRGDGSAVFVPTRYALNGQWKVQARAGRSADV